MKKMKGMAMTMRIRVVMTVCFLRRKALFMCEVRREKLSVKRGKGENWNC
jgi:hypothetical protein